MSTIPSTCAGDSSFFAEGEVGVQPRVEAYELVAEHGHVIRRCLRARYALSCHSHYFPIRALSLLRPPILGSSPRPRGLTRSGTWYTNSQTMTSHADGRPRLNDLLYLLRSLTLAKAMLLIRHACCKYYGQFAR
jgi:hypothetical protein